MSEEDPKAEDIIMDMWVGAESTKCDGKITGYSNLMYILVQDPKKTEPTTTFMEIVTNSFKLNT